MVGRLAEVGNKLEKEAERLISFCDGSVAWAHRWAALAAAAGWPCYGFNSWHQWAADVARTSAQSSQRATEQAR